MVRFTEKDLKRINLDKEGKPIKSEKKNVKLSKQIDDEIIAKNEIFIPCNVPSSKNSKQIHYIFGKIQNPNIISKMRVNNVMRDCIPTITENELSKQYRIETEMYWKILKSKFHNIAKQFIGEILIVEFTFIRSRRNRFDFHNIIQLPMDLMVFHGWINDDDMNNVLPIPPLPPNKPYLINKHKPGLIIKIKNNAYRT